MFGDSYLVHMSYIWFLVYFTFDDRPIIKIPK